MTKFIPPKHWVSPEELTESYWSDSKAQELRGQEFLHKPIETLEWIEKIDQKGVRRRDFMTLMGASMALAGLACTRRPVHKIIPYAKKPEEITPGIPTWYASTCSGCESRCGVLVKTKEGRPIKLEGNPDHPLNQGALCSKGQASVLGLYDPDRSKKVKFQGKDSNWDSLDQAFTQALEKANSAGKKLRILSQSESGPVVRNTVFDLLSKSTDGRWVEWNVLSSQDENKARELAFGASHESFVAWENVDYVLSLGADFLGYSKGAVENLKGWSQKRKLQNSESNLSKVVCFESMMTQTGAAADERMTVRPGQEVEIGLSIVSQLISVHGLGGALPADLKAFFQGFTPAAVASKVSTVTEEQIVRVAKELFENRQRSVVLAGSLTTQHSAALELEMVAIVLNSLLSNEGKTIGAQNLARGSSSGFQGFAELFAEIESGSVGVLVMSGVNPVYDLPKSLAFEEALKKVDFVVHIQDREDETSKQAHWTAPLSHDLESWSDSQPRNGVFSLTQPAIAPLGESRSFGEAIWYFGKSAGVLTSSESWYENLKANIATRWQASYPQGKFLSQSSAPFWEDTLHRGVLDARAPSQALTKYELNWNSVSSSLKSYVPFSTEGLSLAVYESHLGNGSIANNAWMQELPDPISTVTWDNFAAIGPKTAEKFAIKSHDVISIQSGDAQIEIPVLVQPGVAPDTVAIAYGYGRESVGSVGNQVGTRVSDILSFQKSKDGRFVFAGLSVQVKKTGKRHELAMTQGHHRTEGRPVVNDITLSEYRKNPATENHTDPHLRMKTVPTIWPVHEYKGNRWAMAVDLNSCTGCGACVIACQAENNIPTVGREQIRVSREMHWIRLDRYYSGSSENPDVVFQPMMCQHCENASCETVCPVLATVHSDEGLNDMAYNRCVGTRYCQNNCPYKVRRFNYFDHWKDFTDGRNQVYNPDVTVRERGVMEKCTFCVQRITEAKFVAKDQNRKVRDGEVQPACQQTCPTDALVFGNINDPESRVAKMHADARAFRALEILNNKPMVSYLTKVRNKEEGKSHVEHH